MACFTPDNPNARLMDPCLTPKLTYIITCLSSSVVKLIAPLWAGVVRVPGGEYGLRTYVFPYCHSFLSVLFNLSLRQSGEVKSKKGHRHRK